MAATRYGELYGQDQHEPVPGLACGQRVEFREETAEPIFGCCNLLLCVVSLSLFLQGVDFKILMCMSVWTTQG